MFRWEGKTWLSLFDLARCEWVELVEEVVREADVDDELTDSIGEMLGEVMFERVFSVTCCNG